MLWIIDLILTGICWVLGYRLRQAYMESAHWKNEARTYLERYNAMIRAEKDTDEYRMQLYTKLSEENKQLKEQAEKDFSGLMNFSQECARHRERAAKAEATAAAFESAAKTMEEHVAAERGHADRLAAALRESEDKCEQLQKELASKENVLADATKMVRALNIDIDKFMQENGLPLIGRSGSPAVTMDQLAQEFANIAAYNGTDEGQVELKHG